MKKVLAMILAGGKGERLYPLTRDRAKPATPFGGNYRIIDFTISNCINSGYRKIYVLTQYKSLSLDRHIQRAWNFLNNRIGEFVYIIHAQQRINENWYKGTADAIYQNFYTLQQELPDLVLLLSGDHVYKMDYRNLINYHIQKKADLTIASVEMGKEQSKDFGVIQVDDNNRITGFKEKPLRPKLISGNPDKILANMGIYVFNTDILVKRLIENARKVTTQHDFGKNIIPSMLKTDSVFAFPFIDKNTKEPGYWKDVGSIDAYYQANMDILNDSPVSYLDDKVWPVFTYEKLAPPAKISGFEIKDNENFGVVTNSVISKGCIVDRARIDHSVMSANVSAGQYSVIEDSVLLDDVTIGRNCRIRKSIIDKGVIIPDNIQIGYNKKRDAMKFTVTDTGIVVVPRNAAF